MKFAATLKVIYPSTPTAVSNAILVSLGLGGLAAMALAGAVSPERQWLPWLLACACIAMGLIATYRTNVLEEALRVLGMRRAPDALWHAWALGTLAAVTTYWAVICLLMIAQTQMPATPFHWLAATVLLSLVTCLSVQRVLARIGLAARGWAWAIDGSALLLALYAMAGPGFGGAMRWLSGLPLPLLAVCTLAWPVMAYGLRRRWRASLPVRHAVRHTSATLAPGSIFAFFKRYSVLRWDGTVLGAGWHRGKTLGPVMRLFQSELLVYFLLFYMMPAQWGSTAHPLRAAGLFALYVAASHKLAVRDPHWRSLLLPGGMRRGSVGAHILRSTLTLQALLLAGVALAYIAFKLAVGTPPVEVLQRLAGALHLPFELALATSAAVAVRGRYTSKSVGIANAAMIGIAMLAFGIAGPAAGAGEWTIGPAYVLLLAAGTAVFCHLGNRRWTVEKLFREIH